MNPHNLSSMIDRQKKELFRTLMTASLFLSGTLATVVALCRDLQIG